MKIKYEFTADESQDLLDALDIAAEQVGDDLRFLRDPDNRSVLKDPATAVKDAEARQKSFRSLYKAIEGSLPEKRKAAA